MAPPPPSSASKLTLYKDYVKTDQSAGQISAAPVLYSDIQKKEEKAADLKLVPQPTRSYNAKKPKNKGFSIPSQWNNSVSGTAGTGAGTKKSYNDWAEEKVDTSAYVESEQARKRQKKDKKKKHEVEVQEIDWSNETYDLSNPTSYRLYRGSENWYRMQRAFQIEVRRRGGCPNPEGNEVEDPVREGAPAQAPPPPPPPPPPTIPPPPPSTIPPPPPGIPPTQTPRPWYPPLEISPQVPFIQVSDEPVANQPEVNTQTQRKKVENMMKNMGWTKGKGLGANEDGIVEPVLVKAQKRKRGDPPNIRGMGQFVGGTYAEGTETESKAFTASSVLVIDGLLNGVDLVAENERSDGGIRQRMGDAFGKFGNIERIFFNEATAKDEVPVFIKFTQAISAVNALGHFERGALFEGKPVSAQLYNEDNFDSGIFE